MARTFYLKDGRREIVLEDKEVFLERLIREELGDDAAELFASYIQETMDEPRLDRKALTAAAQNGWNDLNNNL